MKKWFGGMWTTAWLVLLAAHATAAFTNRAPCSVRLRQRPCILQLNGDAAQPFANDLKLPPSTLQESLRTDIMRRYTELTLLGWLGRAYLAFPCLWDRFAPTVFELAAYDATAAACFERPGLVDCTLKEGSVGGVKGIPFRLLLETADGDGGEPRIVRASLRAIGCDLTREDAATATSEDGATRMSEERVRALLRAVNGDSVTKQLVIGAIVRAVFGKLAPVAAAVKQGVDLVGCSAAPLAFVPREELWALEGTSHKWVQQVSGYYFAQSMLQEVRFASSAENVRFTFYLDPTEPFNCNDPTRIVNPEVINCVFVEGEL